MPKFVGVEEDRRGREIFPAGVTGLREKLLRGGHVFRDLLHGLISGGARRDEIIGGDLPGAGDGLGDLLAVDGHGQRAAHAHVVERRLVHVEAIEVDT